MKVFCILTLWILADILLLAACSPAPTFLPTGTPTTVPPTATRAETQLSTLTETPELIHIPSLEPTAAAVVDVFVAYCTAYNAKDLDAVMALIVEDPESICFQRCYTDREDISIGFNSQFISGYSREVTILNVEGNEVHYQWRLYKRSGDLFVQGEGVAIVENEKIKADYNVHGE